MTGAELNKLKHTHISVKENSFGRLKQEIYYDVVHYRYEKLKSDVYSVFIYLVGAYFVLSFFPNHINVKSFVSFCNTICRKLQLFYHHNENNFAIFIIQTILYY